MIYALIAIKGKLIRKKGRSQTVVETTRSREGNERYGPYLEKKAKRKVAETYKTE